MQEKSSAHVLTCLAEDCSYNCRDECCAPMIAVGDEHPSCDWYTTGPVELAGGEPGIQDCKVSHCHYNSDMACSAAGITMMTHAGHADCATFRM